MNSKDSHLRNRSINTHTHTHPHMSKENFLKKVKRVYKIHIKIRKSKTNNHSIRKEHNIITYYKYVCMLGNKKKVAA